MSTHSDNEHTTPTAGQEFLERCKIKNQGPSGQQKGHPQPPFELPHDLNKPTIDLAKPDSLVAPRVDLATIIEGRRSARTYADNPISLAELTFLLWCTQGIKKAGGRATFRTVPSAGARHAFETYILVNNVTGLQPGMYRYLALSHQLQLVDDRPELAEMTVAACLDQKFIGTSGATFIWVAVPERMNWVYGERGYRYLHLDAGHVCQNLYLAGMAIECGVCAIAAFDDDAMNELVLVNGIDQFVIYAATVGKKE